MSTEKYNSIVSKLKFEGRAYISKNYTFFKKPIAAPIVVKNPANGRIATAYFLGI